MTSSKEFDLFIKMLLKMLKKGDVQEVIELLNRVVVLVPNIAGIFLRNVSGSLPFSLKLPESRQGMIYILGFLKQGIYRFYDVKNFI